jgi:hypothetical protein
MLDVHDDDDHWCGDAGVQLGIRLISKAIQHLDGTVVNNDFEQRRDTQDLYRDDPPALRRLYTHRNLLSRLGQARPIYPYKEIHPSMESSKNRPP